MLLFLLAFLIGGTFGLIFRVWILLPASLALVFGVYLFQDGSTLAILQRSVIALLCLQGGYGVGLTAGYLLVAGRAKVLFPAAQGGRPSA